INKPFGSITQEHLATALPNVYGLQVLDNGTIYAAIGSNNTRSNVGYISRLIKFNSSGDEVLHNEFASSSVWSPLGALPKQFVDNDGYCVIPILAGLTYAQD